MRLSPPSNVLFPRTLPSTMAAARRQLPRRARTTAAMLTGLLLALIVAGCNPIGGSAAAGGQAVTIAVVPGLDNATVFLAQRDGLFSHAGINVTLRDYSSVGKELTALTNGAVQVAAGDYGDLFFAQANSPSPLYKILADGYDAAPGVAEIVTMPGSSITSPADLAGQAIAAPDAEIVSAPQDAPGSLAIASATSVLQGYGVNLSAVNWTPMPQQQEIEELVRGQAKAILVTGPYIYQAQQSGAVELVDACSGATASIPLSGYFATNSWARDNAAAVTAFQTAIAQAAAQASMPGPVQSLLPAYAGLNKQQADLITTGVYPLTTITANLQRTADLMNDEGMIRIRLNVAAMIVR